MDIFIESIRNNYEKFAAHEGSIRLLLSCDIGILIISGQYESRLTIEISADELVYSNGNADSNIDYYQSVVNQLKRLSSKMETK